MVSLNCEDVRVVACDGFAHYCLLFCRSLSDRSDTSEHVDNVMTWMTDLAAQGDHEARLDFVKCSTALKAHLKFEKFARAASLVNQMIDAYTSGQNKDMPDFKTLSLVIKGLCNNRVTGEADALLRRMWKFNMAVNGFRSTDCLVQQVMHSWQVSGQPGLALSLFECMQRLYTSRVLKEGPSRDTYKVAIASLAKSNDPDKADRVRELQWQMGKSYARKGTSHGYRGIRG